jgi:glycosyltransferase involved in cell wall biosynthesis
MIEYPILLSVVIPTWSRPAELISVLESIGHFQDPEVEIVVCDDGSPEACRKIVKNFIVGKQSIRYIENAMNLGMVRNWNQCIRAANGAWICFVCDDDQLCFGSIERIKEIVARAPGPALYLQDPRLEKDIEFLGAGHRTAAIIKLPIISGNFWHRSLTDTLGGFDERLLYSPDLEFWFRLAYHFPVVVLRDPIANYYLHENNYAFSTWRKDDFLEQIGLLTSLKHRYIHETSDEALLQLELFEAERACVDTILRATARMPSKQDIFRKYRRIALKNTHTARGIWKIQIWAIRAGLVEFLNSCGNMAKKPFQPIYHWLCKSRIN